MDTLRALSAATLGEAGAVVRSIFLLELLERFAYYGSVFTLTTFISVALGGSQPQANAAINAVFAISPLSSLFFFAFADSPRVGRAKVLIVGSTLYAIGLSCFVVAALPGMYHSFPGHPTTFVWCIFGAGIGCLALGYGGFKTVTAPIVASSLSTMPSGDRTKVFQLYTWVVNSGALLGTLISPFLRQTVNDTAPNPNDEGSQVHTAFYVSFALCAGLGVCGALLAIARYTVIRTVDVDRRSCCGKPTRCAKTRGQAALGDYVQRSAGSSERSSTSTLDSAFLVVEADAGCCSPTESLIRTFPALSNGLTDDVKQCVVACMTLVVLPLYWVIQNQFMGNVVFQVQWADTPASLPPAFFNNVNTISMLVSLPLLQLSFSRRGVVPSQRSRMLAGFALTCVGMLMCVGLQIAIESRGYFSPTGDFVAYDGQTPISAWWFVLPYAVSGVASALIDPTAFEAAFQRAPESMRSLVMACYLLMSSLSGWIGIVFTPLATAGSLMLLYGILVLMLGIGGSLWRCLPIPKIDAVVVAAIPHGTSSGSV